MARDQDLVRRGQPARLGTQARGQNRGGQQKYHGRYGQDLPSFHVASRWVLFIQSVNRGSTPNISFSAGIATSFRMMISKADHGTSRFSLLLKEE
jgi:hypothetical protein